MDLLQKHFGSLFVNGHPKLTTEAKITAQYRLDILKALNKEITTQELTQLEAKVKEVFGL